MKTETIFFWTSRLILGTVFVFAAAGKIINPAEFAEAVDNYRLLPYVLVPVTAIFLPWVELLCGVLILAGKWLKGTSLIVLILNILFIIAIASAMLRGLNIECGCFSLAGSAKAGFMRLAEDMVLLLMSVFLLHRSIKN